MVLRVCPEVVGERVDPLRQERYLDPGRTGVGFVPAVLDDHGLFVKGHAAGILGATKLSLSSFYLSTAK
jgi:hypothetical protein